MERQISLFNTSAFLSVPVILRYLLTAEPSYQVIDEADRLITQAFQDWVAQVLAAIQPPSQLSDDTTSPESLPFHDALAPSWSHLSSATPEISANFSEKKESSCQKLLFSATLTRDPSKIAALNLRQPKYFVFKSLDTAVGEETFAETFEMPATLSVRLHGFPFFSSSKVD